MNKYKSFLLSAVVLSVMGTSQLVNADTISDVNSYTSYTINTSATKPSDKIVVDTTKLWTTPKQFTGDVPEESTAVDAMQTYERWVFMGSSVYKLTGSDFDINNPYFKNLLNKTDEDWLGYALEAVNLDMYNVLTNKYASQLHTNPIDIFNQPITPEVFAQVKAGYLRSLSIKDEMQKRNITKYDGKFSDIEKMYRVLEVKYNSQYDTNTEPIIDHDGSVDLAKVKQLRKDIKSLPYSLRRSLSYIYVAGPDVEQDYNLAGVLGYVGQNQYMYLNGRYDNLFQTLQHELGHILDFHSAYYQNGQMLNSFSRLSEFQSPWTTGFTNATEYYTKNSAEAFAEGFGEWYRTNIWNVESNNWLNLDTSITHPFYESLWSKLNTEVTEPTTETEVTEPTTETEVTEPTTETEVTEPNTETEVTEPNTETEVTEPNTETEVTEPIIERKITATVTIGKTTYKLDENMDSSQKITLYENGRQTIIYGSKPSESQMFTMGKRKFKYVTTYTLNETTGAIVRKTTMVFE